MPWSPSPITVYDSGVSPTAAGWSLGNALVDMNALGPVGATTFSLAGGLPTLTDAGAAFSTAGSGLAGYVVCVTQTANASPVVISPFCYLVVSNTATTLTLSRVDGVAGWFQGITPQAGASYSLTNHCYLNASNQLVLTGPFTGTDFQLAFAGISGRGGLLNQEVWIDVVDLAPILTGTFSEIDVFTRGGDVLLGAYGTLYQSYANKSSATALSCGLKHAQMGVYSPVGATTVNGFATGTLCRMRAFALWDEVAQNTRVRQEWYNIAAQGSATPLGGGTLLGSQPGGAGSANIQADLAPGWGPTQLTPTGTPGTLANTGGSACGIAFNPSGSTLVINRIVVRDGAGIDTSAAAMKTPYYQGQKAFSFPGLYASGARSENNSSTVNSHVTVTEHFAPYDMTDVVIGFDNTITCPDLPNNNAITFLASVMYPVNAMSSIPADTQKGAPCYPAYVPGGNRALTLQPGEAGSFLPVVIPGRIKAGEKFLICNMQIRPAPGVVGSVLTGDPRGDSGQYLSNIAALPPGAAPVIRAFYFGIGSFAANTYHIVTTFKNQGSGETTASAEVVVPTTITGTAAAAYGANSQGYLTVTDTGQSLPVNMYAGAQLQQGGNNYTVLSNTATVWTLTATAWGTGGQPAPGAAYTVRADLINVTPAAAQGAQNFCVYVGTTAPVSGGTNASYSTAAPNVTLTDSGASWTPSAYVGAQVTVTGVSGNPLYTVVANTATVLTMSPPPGIVGWNGATPNPATNYSMTGPYTLQGDPAGLRVSGNPVLFRYAFSTNGVNPPVVNTALYDYTLIPSPTGSTPLLNPSVANTLMCHPAFVGGSMASVSPTVIGALGSNNEAAIGDFGFNAVANGSNNAATAAGGWVERAFKRSPGVVSVILAKTGQPLVADFSDTYHWRQWQARLRVLRSCNVALLDHWVNETAPLAYLQAAYQALIAQIAPLGCPIWACTGLPSTGVTPINLFTTVPDQYLTVKDQPGGITQQFNAWLMSLIGTGLAGVIDLYSVMANANGTWRVIAPGSTYVDPGTGAALIWSDTLQNTGVSTAVASGTLTDSGANNNTGWAVNQWSASGLYVVTSGGSSALIASNTATVLTLKAYPTPAGFTGGTANWTQGTPPTGPYVIRPVTTLDGLNPSPHGHALMAAAGMASLPAMKAAISSPAGGGISF